LFSSIDIRGQTPSVPLSQGKKSLEINHKFELLCTLTYRTSKSKEFNKKLIRFTVVGVPLFIISLSLSLSFVRTQIQTLQISTLHTSLFTLWFSSFSSTYFETNYQEKIKDNKRDALIGKLVVDLSAFGFPGTFTPRQTFKLSRKSKKETKKNDPTLTVSKSHILSTNSKIFHSNKQSAREIEIACCVVIIHIESMNQWINQWIVCSHIRFELQWYVFCLHSDLYDYFLFTCYVLVSFTFLSRFSFIYCVVGHQ
jgi:hypothetical protein